GCFTDTSQANFQAGIASNLDLTSTPGSVKLATGAGAIDQQNTSVGSTGQAITTTTWEAETFTPAVTRQLTHIDAARCCRRCAGGRTEPQGPTPRFAAIPASTAAATTSFRLTAARVGP